MPPSSVIAKQNAKPWLRNLRAGVLSAQHNGWMSLDAFVVTCPYCGEESEIYVEPDVTGSFVQDCEVCCNPWRVRVSGEGEDRSIDVGRADGSE